jgi:hypothetical protein
MAHYLIDNDKCPDLPYGNEGDSHPSGYRFGRGDATYAHGRSILNRVNGYLKTLIEAVANAKLRRMRRELELRGVRLDQLDEAWMKESRGDASRRE